MEKDNTIESITPEAQPQPSSVEQTPEQQTERAVAWYDILAMSLIFLASQGVGGLVVYLFGVTPPNQSMLQSVNAEILEIAESRQARYAALAYLAAMILCFVLLKIYRAFRGWKNKLSFRSLGWASPFRLLCGYILLWCITVAIEPLAEQLPSAGNIAGGGGWLLFSAVILAPIFEETIFRGYLAGALRYAYGTMTAWILSSLIFGLAHIAPASILTASLCGLVLGFYYLRYRSLTLVVVLHAMNNLTACFLHTIDMEHLSVRDVLGGGELYSWTYAICVFISVIAFLRMTRVLYTSKSDNYSI